MHFRFEIIIVIVQFSDTDDLWISFFVFYSYDIENSYRVLQAFTGLVPGSQVHLHEVRHWLGCASRSRLPAVQIHPAEIVTPYTYCLSVVHVEF